MSASITKFEAREQAMGYMYQMDYALWLLMDKGRANNDISVSIEEIDDVLISGKDGVVVNQVKYHNENENLTDRSSDFWKTIRVWCEQITNGQIQVDKTIFVLTTTSQCAANSFTWYLKCEGERKPADALMEMKRISAETTNKTNGPGYIAFNNLSSSEQNKLLENVFIVDGSCDTGDLQKKIREFLIVSINRLRLDEAVQELCGWWGERCREILSGHERNVSFLQLQTKILNISRTYQDDNLPDSFSNYSLTDEDNQSMMNSTFVQQLRLIGVGSHRMNRALSNFKRAYYQRAKWIENGDVEPSELEKYNDRLRSNWEDLVAGMLDTAEGIDDKEQLVKLGLEFYDTYMKSNLPSIRTNYQQEYFAIGSSHYLADKMEIGWHPQYKQILNNE